MTSFNLEGHISKYSHIRGYGFNIRILGEQNSVHNIFFFFILLLAVLGLRCCAWAFSTCGEWGLLFVEVHWLLTAVASLVMEHGL